MEKHVTHAARGGPWTGVPQSTTLPEVLIQAGTGLHRQRPVLLFEDGMSVTSADLLKHVEGFSSFIAERIQPGETVAVAIANRVEFFIACFAIARAGGVFLTMNPAAGEMDAIHILSDARVVGIVCDDTSRPLMSDLRSRLSTSPFIVGVEGEEPLGLSGHRGSHDLPFPPAIATDPVFVLYTSGSTGLPKGCVTDHTAWTRCIDLDVRLAPDDSDVSSDRVLCPTPFFYGNAVMELLIALHTGGSVVAFRRFSVSRFWPVVHSTGVTVIQSVGAIPTLLFKAPVHPLERAHQVRKASHLAIPPGLQAEMNERWGFPWIDGYGTQEAGPVSTIPVDHVEEMVGSGSIGVPYPEVDVRIVDEEGQEVPTGEAGEAEVKAPGIFHGYLNNPDATAAVLRDGYYRTGDLVSRDDRGFLYFAGRTKDIIRRSGENVSAVELEEVLRGHPGVRDAAAIAVPDETVEEEIKVYIVTLDADGREAIPPEEIVRYCEQRLAPHKVPRYIEYLEGDLPRTPSMRVQKNLLRESSRRQSEDVWDRERSSVARHTSER